ncbi:MAG: hypothetical protein AAGI11_14525 [Pseudomonadota bacterium]
MRPLLLILLLAGLCACASGGGGNADEIAPQTVDSSNWPAPLGSVELARDDRADAAALLDLALSLFDPGIPEDPATHSKLGVFPEIRKAEAGYLPVLMREVLINSNAWGVVRVLPEPEDSAELLLTGTIVHSDGLRLVLDVEVVDASGRLWLMQRYHDETVASDYPATEDPYADLYRAVANDLLQLRRELSERDLVDIRRVARLRYAQSLSPEAFGGYLNESEGQYTLLRYPAPGDPMMARVERIRNQEYLFVDNIDEQYAELKEQMRPTYDLWRQYGREQALYREEYRQRVAERDRQGRRGSFAAMSQAYSQYRSSKIQEQDLRELAGGFDNEVAPTIMQASDRVFRLDGTLDAQYAEWRSILRQIFALETGL